MNRTQAEEMVSEFIAVEKLETQTTADERTLGILNQCIADLRLSGDTLRQARDLAATVRQQINDNRNEASERRFAAMHKMYTSAE